MTQVKVRHGLISYVTREGGKEVSRYAFRNQVLDIPAPEADRLGKLNAVVDPNTELALGGNLSPLPNTASDQELIAWASVANRAEIIKAIKERPEVGDRILAAYETVQREMERQSELLGGLRPTLEEITRERAEPDEPDLIGEGGGSGAPLPPVDDENDPDSVVKHNVEKVSAWLAANPGRAQEILEAESRLAEAQKRNVRTSVVQAAQAAAAHNASQ